MRKFFVYFITVLLITLFASPAMAQQGNTVTAYHLAQDCREVRVNANAIGNGQFYATLASCLAALNPSPTATQIVPTNTAAPTNTSVPTQNVTLEPSPTGTIISTLESTSTAFSDSNRGGARGRAEFVGRGRSCQVAYEIIRFQKHKDVGYQILENHPWCYTWILNRHGYAVPQQQP